MAIEQSFIRKLSGGERGAMARAISMIENGHRDATDLLKKIYPLTGKAHRIGITGPPGAGKSTITNKLAKLFRAEGKRVGILAVDPTSPFTGGALLGDRVRMTDVELDEGVFIRSMASRGSLGGLSEKAKEAADVLDAAGCDAVLMETVGVGQSELDIARAADTTVVVLVPESGDSIQAMKAGLMEIADFFVVNKADRPGADQAVMSISMVLNFRPKEEGWRAEVLQTVASQGKGIDAVAQKIRDHIGYLTGRGLLAGKREARVIERIRELVGKELQEEFWNKEREKSLSDHLGEIVALRQTPYEFVERLLGKSGR